MLCRATRICFADHVQNHNTLQRLKVIFVKIDNRCCYRRESELTVQTRNTCYQLQKIVLVFFFFLFRHYSFIRFMTIYYTQISDIIQISTGSHVKIARRTATKADAKPQHESLLES